MQSEVMFAGFGGQGILLSAKILAHAALEQGFEVVWIPSYGPEMRGGTAYCMVVISDRPIGSPIVRNPGNLVAMNGPSRDKFAPKVKPGGVILVNASLVAGPCGRQDVDELMLPVNDIAMRLGSIKAANIVALAAFAARSGLADLDLLKHCVASEFAAKPQVVELNLSAVEEGYHAGKKP